VRQKRWGDEPYYGLDHEFDPLWLLTPEQLELQEELIRVCHDVIRPQAIECDRTGAYPRESLEALAKLGLLAIIAPPEYGGRGEGNVGTLMVTETIARYGCPSTALIYMMHMVAVAGLVYRAHDNPEIRRLLARIDPECLVGSASYTDPETGGHFWYPKTSGAERVPDGWHVRKTAAWTTSSGYASWYICQTTSPDFSGDYSDLSVFLLYADEVQAKPGLWDAMGMHANQSGPVEIDAVIPADRIVGWPGDGAASNDEAIDPLAMVMYAGAYNGVALACIDVAKRHATRRTHAQYGRSIADYPTTQHAFGGAVADVQASRMYAYAFAKALDDATDGGDWLLYARDPHAKPRAAFTSWSLPAKLLAARVATRVSDAMLHVCGGRGYMRAAEIERLVRDSKAGWVMAPSNEVTQLLYGKWALHGADAVDWWNQKVDEPALQNELSKLDRDGKQRIVDQLAAEIANVPAT
jgi:alkylation response protein AidB-like acyl-CoA dehydrogenase